MSYQTRQEGLTEIQRVAAAMLGRGKTRKAVAAKLEVTERTITRWRKLSEFAEEEQRVRVNSSSADPRGVLIDALSARKDDDIDWQSRLKAAFALLGDDTAMPPNHDEDDYDGPLIRVNPAARKALAT
jgi:hypothetical protein